MLAHIPTPYWSCMNLLEVGSFLPSLLVEYSFFLALLRNYLIAWEGLRVYSGLNNVIYFGGIGHWNRVLLHIYHRLAANSPSSSLSLLSVGLYPAITYLYIVIMSIKARYSKGFSQLRGSWAHCPWTPPPPSGEKEAVPDLTFMSSHWCVFTSRRKWKTPVLFSFLIKEENNKAPTISQDLLVRA